MTWSGIDPLDRDVAVPVDAPLYRRPAEGWWYRGTTFTAVTFETDREAAAALLPPGLRLAHDPPRATFLLLECDDSAFGAYDELKVELAVELEGDPQRYCPYILVSARPGLLAPDAALAMGREVMGVPKKIAHIAIERGEEGRLVVRVERPRGRIVCAITAELQEAVTPAEVGLDRQAPALHLRLIPSVDGGPPSVSELVRWDTEKTVQPGSVRAGSASVTFPGADAGDPWHRLAVRRVLQAAGWRGDLTIPPRARVVRNYRERA